MAGTIVQAFPKRAFDFSQLNGIQQQGNPIAERINVAGWAKCSIVARVHAANIVNGSQFINFEVYRDGYAEEDPGADFKSLLYTVSLVGPVVAPSLVNPVLIPPGFGPFLKILVRASNAAFPTPLTATVSMSLMLRNPD